MKRTLTVIVLFLLLSLVGCATGEKDKKAQPLSQTQQSASPFFTGDGGKGMSLAIIAPKASGLEENQGYLPALIQREFVSNFQGFSAIDVLDYERLGDQYDALLSGYFDENAGGDLGHLPETTHIMSGNITRTATGYALQMNITRNADKMTVAPFSGTCTFVELDNLTGVRRASLELLEKMGVVPTERMRTELAGAAEANRITAQTALAQGITAQRQGTEVAALSYYYQAATYDPSLAEAASRTSVLNTSISSGNIGSDVRNDIQWRKDWIAKLTETEQFIDSFNRKESMPYMLYYTADIKQVGQTNYQNETVTLGSITTHLHGRGIWTLSVERALQAVYDGLQATERANTWGLDGWPRRGVTNLNISANRRQNFSVVFELLNSRDKVIGRQTLQTGGSWGLNWSGRPVAEVSADERQTLNFQNVNANDLHEPYTIRIASVNGEDAETAARKGVLQIRASTKGEFDRNDRFRFNRGTIQGFANNTAHTGELVIPASIWGDPVIWIGEGFKNIGLTSVTIPGSITSIPDEAFINNRLTNVTIREGVTTIGRRAFADNLWPSGRSSNSFDVGNYYYWLNSVSIAESVTSIGHNAFIATVHHSTGSYTPLSPNYVRIGANVTLNGAIGNNFAKAYTAAGKQAGVYRWVFKFGGPKWERSDN